MHSESTEENAALVHELNQLRMLKCSLQREVKALTTKLNALENGTEEEDRVAAASS